MCVYDLWIKVRLQEEDRNEVAMQTLATPIVAGYGIRGEISLWASDGNGYGG
jgi:hypothetical protein